MNTATLTLLTVLLWGLQVGVVKTRTIERVERMETRTWHLAMNLNPSDGHMMSYTVGWTDDVFIGTHAQALTKDYLNRLVWRHPVSYIAIVRHHAGEVDAVKVFRFKESDRSMLSRFNATDPGREVVTEGGPLQVSVSNHAQNMDEDAIFSVGGDLAFNWMYTNNGHRIVMTGGHLSTVDSNDDKTRGLGNDLQCNPKTGVSVKKWASEVLNIASGYLYLLGTDFGAGWKELGRRGRDSFGNYAIFVSEEANSFPGPGYKLGLTVEAESKPWFDWHGGDM